MSESAGEGFDAGGDPGGTPPEGDDLGDVWDQLNVNADDPVEGLTYGELAGMLSASAHNDAHGITESQVEEAVRAAMRNFSPEATGQMPNTEVDEPAQTSDEIDAAHNLLRDFSGYGLREIVTFDEAHGDGSFEEATKRALEIIDGSLANRLATTERLTSEKADWRAEVGAVRSGARSSGWGDRS